MVNKKAMELSINFIVMLIIGILLFGMSISFLFKWFGKAEELKGEIDKKTHEQILTALKAGNERVAIPFAIQKTSRGKPVTFGIGVRNTKTAREFTVAAAFSAAYSPNGDSISVDPDYITDFWLGAFSVSPEIPLKKNQQEVYPMLIRATINIASNSPTPPGDYVFNVCVYDSPPDVNGQPPVPCSPEEYRRDSSKFYTGKIYQVTVRVQ